MSETLSADFLSEFGHPTSQGVTSLLRECLGDEGLFDEVDSGTTVQPAAAPQRSPAAGLPQLGVHSIPHGEADLTSEAVPLGHEFQLARLNARQAQAFAAASPEETVAGTAAVTLGTNTLAMCHGTSAEGPGRKKRGRKPLPRLPDLQQKLQGLTEQLQRLTDENVFLRNKLKVLERVVPYRDESVGYLTQLLSSASAQAAAAARRTLQGDVDGTGPLPRSPDSQGESPTTSGDHHSSCSGQATGSTGEAHSSHARPSNGSHATNCSGAQGARCTHTDAPAGLAAAEVMALSGILGRERSSGTGRAAGQSAWGKPPTVPSPAPGTPAPGTPTVLALCPSPDDEVPEITLAAVEELKRITPAEFRLLWKHVCLQLGVLVTAAEVHGPGSSPYVRLERFLERALSYMDKLTLLSPACFVQSMYMNVESGQPERPSDNFWVACARSLNLTPQQLAEVHSLAAVYEQNVVPVVQQRLQLAMQLSTRLAATTAQPTSTAGDALTALSSVEELTQQLERNVLKEHETHWNIGDFLCSSVLSPLQVAKALTVTYPYIPDGVAMLHAFRVLSSNDSARAAQHPPTAGAPQHTQGHSGQQFPSFAGLLAGQLPALAGPLAAGGLAAPSQPSAANPSGAALAGLAAGLQSSQLQGLMSGLQPPQLQGLLSGLQPSQLQAVLAGLQTAAALGRAGGQPLVAAAPAGLRPAQPAAGVTCNPQLQALAALLGASAGGNTAGRQAGLGVLANIVAAMAAKK